MSINNDGNQLAVAFGAACNVALIDLDEDFSMLSW